MDHQHQRGLWFAHDNVNKLDFWNNEWSYVTDLHRQNPGRIGLKQLGEVKSGKDKGSIAATFEWGDIEKKSPPILTESRLMTFYSDDKLRYFDVDITLTAIQQVTFGDGKDGVFGIRLRPLLQEDKDKEHPHIVNADGMEGEKALWGKPSNWCDYSGTIGTEKLGVAILDHPDNPRHPVRWHARAYGLFAANPFGLSVFTGDKSQDEKRDAGAGQEPALPVSRDHPRGRRQGRQYRRPVEEVSVARAVGRLLHSQFREQYPIQDAAREFFHGQVFVLFEIAVEQPRRALEDEQRGRKQPGALGIDEEPLGHERRRRPAEELEGPCEGAGVEHGPGDAPQRRGTAADGHRRLRAWGGQPRHRRRHLRPRGGELCGRGRIGVQPVLGERPRAQRHRRPPADAVRRGCPPRPPKSPRRRR